MKKSLSLFIVVGMSIWGAGMANADVIVGWEVAGIDLDATGASGIDGNSTSSPFTYSATTEFDANVNGTLTLSSGVTSSTTGSKYGFKVPGGQEQATLAGAISSGHYMQFSIAIASGFQLNLSSLEMNGEATGTGANDVAVLSSVNGFTAPNVIDSVTGVAGVTGGFDTDGSGFGGPIDLSDSAYQGLSGTVDFRIYGYNTSSGGGSTRLRSLSGDDLVVNGTLVAVPEPSTSVLLMMGLGLLVHLRRRK